MENSISKCCGFSPTLRVRPRIVLTAEIAYVRYECIRCGSCSPLSITESEAAKHWQDENEVKETGSP